MSHDIEVRGSGMSFGAEREIMQPKEKYLQYIKKGLNIILKEQNPSTGLFPAATGEHCVSLDHYDHAWIRDTSMVVIALFDPEFLSLFPPYSKTGNTIRMAGVESIKNILSLLSDNPWQSAFQQEVKMDKDPYGREYTVLTQDAPPVHLKTNGEPCPWPTQNQPDSWGELLIAVSLGLRQKLFTLDTVEQETIEGIARFLVKQDIDLHEQTSMWELGRVHHPAPISTTAIVAKGLQDIAPHLSYMSEPTRRTVVKLTKVANTLYPIEYTIPENHHSRTDLATLVAYNLHAFGEVPLFPYYKISNDELGNGQFPGKKRYLGDNYYSGQGGKEAIWPMGALLEANLFLGRSIGQFGHNNVYTGEGYRQKGLQRLLQVTTLIDQYGYIPELLQQINGRLVPNNNHLLWNEALMIQACSRAIIADRFKPEV